MIQTRVLKDLIVFDKVGVVVTAAFFSPYYNFTGCTFVYNNKPDIITFDPNKEMNLIYMLRGSSHHKGE